MARRVVKSLLAIFSTINLPATASRRSPLTVMPPCGKPKRIHGRTIWDKVAVDKAFDILDGGLPRGESGAEIYNFEVGTGAQAVIRYDFRPPMIPQIIALKALYENRGTAIHPSQTPKGVGSSAFYKLSYIGFARHVPRSARGKDSDWFESTKDGEQAWLQILKDNPGGIDWLR
jgi:hypothetical protein